MEESFELLSSMSPKVKGQKTIKVKKVSKLALRKHFRRSSIFDKSLPVKNENLAIIDLSTETSESVASTKEFNQNRDKNDMVIIDSTDSEEEKKSPKRNNPRQISIENKESKDARIKQWLTNVEEDQKIETFFTQVSTIIGDEISSIDNNINDGNRIAACSTFNDYLTYRFDELFINKKNDIDPGVTEDKDKNGSVLSDDSFSLGINMSLKSKLKNLTSNRSGSKSPRSVEKDLPDKNKVVVDKTLLTSDESISKISAKKVASDEGFVSMRKKNDIEAGVTKDKAKNDSILSDESFSLGINTRLTSKLKTLSSNRSSDSKSPQGLEKGLPDKKVVIDKILLTSDESVSKTPPKKLASDEQFVSSRKGNDIDAGVKEEKNKNDSTLSDDSFSLGLNISLTSKPKDLGSNKSSDSKSPRGLEKDLPSKNKVISKKILLPSEENILKTPKSVGKDDRFVSVRKKNDNKIVPECTTPSGQNIQEVKSILDSLYGKKWREKQDSVLLPLSEPKKKQAKENKVAVPKTERIVKPKIKENLLNNVKPTRSKLNFGKLKQPVQSPWVAKLKGLVDSDSDSNTEPSMENNLRKTKGTGMFKIKLDFDEDSPPESKVKTKAGSVKKKTTCTNSNKENDSKKANKKIPKKSEKIVNPKNNRITKKITKTNSGSTSSTNSCSEEDISSDEEYDKEITMLEIKRKSMLPSKNKAYSFLESLSGNVPLNKCDTSARIFRSNFKQYREELGKKLFAIFNEQVFGNAIPKDSELEWNDKLRKTAGLCYCKKITHSNGNVERKVRIALSTKVVDSSDRLRDTLIHEMCHAATWIVNQISDGHGTYWKNWAFKAMNVFPELPPIQRCHTYAINSKYTYRCTGCGYSFGRHSKSLDIERKRCGHCYGKFEVLLNKTTKGGGTKAVPVTPRKEATGFALFVKENYALYKDPSKKHGDIMKVLGQKFAELKVKSTI